MGKIKNVFQNMSLKKSLVLLAVFCLSIVSVLIIITVLAFSGMRQSILDTRPLHIYGYTDEYHGESGGMVVEPNDFAYGTLSGENQRNYRAVTVFMVMLPVIYIILASVAVAKFYYKWKLQAPLKDLKSGIHHISGQNLDFRMEYSSRDELGQLCDTFEQMRNELYKNNCKMWDMLQERKALTASVSHDLRTPITVIGGYLDYLNKAAEKNALTGDILRTTLENMTAAASRLERYVDCVRDVQKMEDIEIRTEQMDLKKWIADMASAFSMLAEQNKRQLEIRDFSKTPFIRTDQDMLSKVLENIFSNALRFSEKQIVLIIEETDDCVSFSIQDDGAGFAQEELSCAALLFYTQSAPLHTCPGRTGGGNFGIGLSICKILCGKLGGVLHLENGSGRGAVVTAKISKCGDSGERAAD